MYDSIGSTLIYVCVYIRNNRLWSQENLVSLPSSDIYWVNLGKQQYFWQQFPNLENCPTYTTGYYVGSRDLYMCQKQHQVLHMLGRGVIFVFEYYICITRAADRSSRIAQGWLDAYSHTNRIANMEMKDRKKNLVNNTCPLTLFVKKQKEIGNSQAFLSLW